MGNWQSGLTGKITVQDQQFQRSMARLIRMIDPAEVRDLLINTAKRFAGSAANAMPPGRSKFDVASGGFKLSSSAKIPRNMLFRRVRDLSKMEEINGSPRKFLRNAHFGPNKWAFAVLALKPRSKFRYFSTAQEAKAFSAIPTRGAAKYGWLQGVVALGGAARLVVPANFPGAKNAGRLMAKAGSTSITGGADPKITIENHSTAAGPMHLQRSELAGKRLANSGLRYALKAKEKAMQREFDL